MIFGPDVSSLFLSICLIAVPAVAFCIKIILKIHDEKPPGNDRWFPVLFGGLSLTILVSFDLIGLKISLNIFLYGPHEPCPVIYFLPTIMYLQLLPFLVLLINSYFMCSIFLIRLSI